MDYFDDPNLCLVCFGYHPLKYCKYFKTFTTIQRVYLVQVHGYCAKCFSKVHRVHECTLMNSCGECEGPHHTMLHPMDEVESECFIHPSCRSHSRYCPGDLCSRESTFRRRLHHDTPYRDNQCSRSDHRYHNPDLTDSPSTSRTARLFGEDWGSAPRYGTNTQERPFFNTPRTSSTFPSRNSEFATASRLGSIPQCSKETPHYCSNPFCPYNLKPSVNRARPARRMTDAGFFPYTENVGYPSTSPKSELFSELNCGYLYKKSPASPSAESPLHCSYFSQNPFTTRRSRSSSSESKPGSDDEEEQLEAARGVKDFRLSRDPFRDRKACKSTDKNQAKEENTRVQKNLKSSSKVTQQRKDVKSKTLKAPSVPGRKSDTATKKQKSKQTTKEKLPNQHEILPGSSTLSMQPEDFHHIAEHLKQIQRHLKNPKEHWHTPANGRRQALLRQELSQLKTQLKQLIQDMQQPNAFTKFPSKFAVSPKDLTALLKLLSGLLQKCHTLTTSKELISAIQQLKEFLQHQIHMHPKLKDNVLKFHYFLKELQNLECECPERDQGRRLDVLRRKLSLRILLRQMLKAVLAQLASLLQKR